MGSKKKGDFSQKHPKDAAVDVSVRKEIEKKLKGEDLPCAVAFQIAKVTGRSPGDVGKTADLLELRISKCQLGLFGYLPEKKIVNPADTVEEALKEAVSRAVKDGRMSCTAAWEIAASLGISKMAVSAACEAMKIKINACQLGAF